MVLSGTGGFKTQGLTTAPENHGDTTPGSASMYAKISEMEHRFQRHFDAQEQTIKDLRRELEEHVARASDLVRVAPTIMPRLKEMEETLATKASHEDVAKRGEDISYHLSRKADSAELRDRLQMHRVELQSEVQQRVSRDDVKEALKTRASSDEVERLFERQVQSMHALQQKLSEGLQQEENNREEALSELRDAVTEELRAMKDHLEQQVSTGLGQLKRSVEEVCVERVRASAAEEGRRRSQALAALQKHLEGMVSAVERSLQSAWAAEARAARPAEDPGVHHLVQAASERVLEEVHRLIQNKASMQDVADSVNILTERIVDNHREVDRKVANFPTRAELSEELVKKASQADVLKLGDSKADHGDVQSYMERHKQAWQTVQERIDSGLSAEADQRRKGDAMAKDLVVGELSSMRKELQQRLELEITTVKQDIDCAREMVETQLRGEANAQHHALTLKRQAMKEEIATDFVAIVQQEVQSHINGSRLPRLERQVLGMEEAARLEHEATNSFKGQMYEALEALAQDQLRALGKLKTDMGSQLEHQSLRMLDEAVAALDEHVKKNKENHTSTRAEIDALTRMIENGLLREQQARQEGLEAVGADIAQHLESVRELEESATTIIEAHASGLASTRDTMQESITKEVERRINAELESLRRRTDVLRSKFDEGLQVERDARLQTTELVKEELEQQIKIQLDSAQLHRGVVPQETLKQSINNVLKADGTLLVFQQSFADEVVKMNAECANAIKSLQVDVEAALKVMQKSMVENTYTELKARIKKEVDKAQHPALQSICAEFEERLKQESDARLEMVEAMEARMDKDQAGWHREVKALQAQLAQEGAARQQALQAALDELGQGVSDRLAQASHLDELRDDMKARLSAERKDRAKAMQDIYHEMEQKLQRMEGIREDVLKETEARWSHMKVKQSTLKKQMGDMLNSLREAIADEHHRASLVPDYVQSHQAGLGTGSNNYNVNLGAPASTTFNPLGVQAGITGNLEMRSKVPSSAVSVAHSTQTHAGQGLPKFDIPSRKLASVLSRAPQGFDEELSEYDGGNSANTAGVQVSDSVTADAAYAAGYASGYAYTARSK